MKNTLHVSFSCILTTIFKNSTLFSFKMVYLGRGAILALQVMLAFYARITTAGLCPVIASSFFNQTLNQDVSNPSPSARNGTFQQQYQLNASYFRPGGPILLYQGAESPQISCVENIVIWDWAKEMGAIVAGLEYRYFGLSVLTGFNASKASPSKWDPLTMNNTLLDSVNFINWIKKTVPGAKNSKAIVIGGNSPSPRFELMAYCELPFRFLRRNADNPNSSFLPGNILRCTAFRA